MAEMSALEMCVAGRGEFLGRKKAYKRVLQKATAKPTATSGQERSSQVSCPMVD